MTEELMTRKVKDICNEANSEITLVIWEKGGSRNGGNKKKTKKTEHCLPRNTHTYACVSGGEKCLFFGKLNT